MPDELQSDELPIDESIIIVDTEKPRRSFRFIPITLAIITLVAIISVILLYAYYLTEINKPVKKTDQEFFLTIEKGMSTVEIAEYLQDEGLIRHPLLLQIYMYLNQDKTIQAGFYRISSPDATFETLISEFQEGSFEVKLTFIEGWRVEQYQDYLEEKMGNIFARQFIESSFIKEGYMFPDTYIIDRDYEPENLASTMRNTFGKRFTQDMEDKAGLRGLTLNQVVILASILERETNTSIDRPIVAGILIKRWKNDWKLQADATIQYAKGKKEDWWPVVKLDDYTGVSSSYNTYLIQGLPPGPISNPGLSSLKAVVDYEETPYWFYITGKDGITRYARTLEEHNRNIDKYLK